MRVSLVALMVLVTACPAVVQQGTDAGATLDAGPGSVDAGPTHPGFDAGAAECQPCELSSDCISAASCVQLLGANVCGIRCANAGQCLNGAQCLQTTTLEGTAVGICVSSTGVCGAAPCGGSCGADATCDVMTGNCVPHDAGVIVVPHPDAGMPTGSVGINGGTVSQLYFAVLGDTRPPLPNDTAGYPTSTITGIFQSIEAMSPKPQFVVGTGDYQYVLSPSPEATKQIGLFMSARANYSGSFFPAMGNHECTAATSSNCSTNQTTPYKAFIAAMMQPLAHTLPYYTFDVNASDGTWTSKFIIAACNAWDSTQSAWLATQLARKTTYTFVIRHEPLTVAAPCTAEMDAQLATADYTMFLSGHSHTFGHTGKQLIEGTGGAPLTGNATYGYATIEQLPNNTMQVTQYDSRTRQPVASYTVP